MALLCWEHDAAAIRSRPAALKIVLKTRNERLLLRGMIDHHLPIVGAIGPPELVGHNWQAPFALFDPPTVGNAVIVHLRHLSAEQRIASNLEKLGSYSRCHGLLRDAGLTGEVSLDDVRTVDADRLIPTARKYVEEIRALLSGRELIDPERDVPTLRLEGGRLVFADRRERRQVLGFLSDPGDVIAEALSSESGARPGGPRLNRARRRGPAAATRAGAAG